MNKYLLSLLLLLSIEILAETFMPRQGHISEQFGRDAAASEMTKEETYRSIAQPAVLALREPTLAEQSHNFQPQIEKAIRDGNFAEAYHLWIPLAEAGDAAAQYGIGWMYHNGYGLAIDDQKAHEWWSRAAAQDHVEAIFSIGTLYQFGYETLKKDIQVALSYYFKAAESGHEESKLILNSMLQYNDPQIAPVLSALLAHYIESEISGEDESQGIIKKMVLQKNPRIVPFLPELLRYYRDSAVVGEKGSQQLLRTLMINRDSRAKAVVAELLQNHPEILGATPARVRTKWANTRMGPGTQYKALKLIKRGVQLMIIDRQNGWFLCQRKGSNKRFWISARLVRLTR